MALSICKECDGKVSTLAKTCPHCGVPNPAIKTKTSIKTKSPTISRGNDNRLINHTNIGI